MKNSQKSYAIARRQEVIAGTERWIRLHDLIIKGELAPDVSFKTIYKKLG